VRTLAAVLPALLLAACAATPDDPLVWSDELARELPLERGASVAAARFSRARPGAVPFPWEPYIILRGGAQTDYRVVELDGMAVVEANGREGGSALYRRIRIDPRRHPILEWRWQVPAPGPGEAPLGLTSSKSPVARVSLAFHGDTAKLDFDDRAHLRLAKALTHHGLPYASLVYAWIHGVPVDTVLPSPYTPRARLIVVENGEKPLGEWVAERRNVLDDYRRAFGEEPGDIVAVGVMTDHGDDGSARRAFYGDITFRGD
jgi:Protein of unknown function (DUF3047)